MNARQTAGQRRQIEKWKDEVKLARRVAGIAMDALTFYGDPDTYWAIGFVCDRPCGDLRKDFEIIDGRARPGKRARRALSKLKALLDK